MRRLWILVLLLLGWSVGALEFTEVWKKHSDGFWALNPQAVRGIFAELNLTPVERRKRDLRGYWRDRNRSPLTLLDQRVGEVIFSFGEDGKLAGVEFQIYNRGDAGPMAGKEFKRIRLDLQNRIGSLLAVGEPEKDSLRLAGVAHSARVWRGAAANARLRWCDADDPDYLALSWRSPALTMEPLKEAFAGTATKGASAEQVREINGFKVLDIPMVNQGAKGYCAAATLARILKYYGSDADQNAIAVLARTESTGTRIDDVVEAFDKIKGKCGLRVESVYRCRDFENYSACQDFLSRYNNLARKMRRERLDWDDFVEKSGNTRRLQLARLLKSAMAQPDVYQAFRLKDKKNFEKFRDEIKKNIDAGFPLVWIVPGHMRIINGYAVDGSRIVYTDSWGKGHERKTVKLEDAWTFTYAVWALTPRRQ